MFKLKSAVLMGCLALSAQSQATVLELALVLDGSGSINSTEYQLQLSGYYDALTSGTFYDDYIVNSSYDEVYLSAWQFSSSITLEADWTLIDSNDAATAFGELFTTTEMSQIRGGTNTSLAIDTVVSSLLSNSIGSTDDDAMVIDISTDGYPSSTSAALSSAEDARTDGVTINAIGVGSGIGEDFLEELVAADTGVDNEGFYLTANDFTEFNTALETKLSIEVSGSNNPTAVPEPASLGIFSAGLLFLGGALRRRNKHQ